jgi:putative holliday junction resolvase
VAGPPGPVLGLDLGDVRIGVALSDPDRRLAVPIGTVHVGRPPGELRAIAELVAEHGATQVVLGLPRSLDGSDGPAAGRARAFADALRAALSVPVLLHDERLSTVEADRSLAEAGVPSRDRRAVIDAAAAQVILTSWLDVHRGDPPPGP